jgi:hypothetical protein
MLVINTPNQSRTDAAEKIAALRASNVDVTVVPQAVFERLVEGLAIDTGRNDAAGDTFFLARELEAVSAQTYDVLVNPLVGRQILPFDYSVPEGAEEWGYDMYEGTAQVEWITNWATPVGGTTVSKFRTSLRPDSFSGQYQFTDQDLARAAFARSGRSLNGELARFNRIGHETFIDDLVANGDATRGMAGFTNHASIPIVTPAVGTWDASTTTAELFRDLTKLAMAPEQATAGQFRADTLVLPLVVKPLLAKPYSDTIPDSVISVWLRSQSDIKTVIYWDRLNTASTGSPSGGPRAIAFKKDPAVVSFMLSYDYREKPPQVVGFTTQVLTSARVMGVCLRYALACAYMDLDESPG